MATTERNVWFDLKKIESIMNKLQEPMSIWDIKTCYLDIENILDKDGNILPENVLEAIGKISLWLSARTDEIPIESEAEFNEKTSAKKLAFNINNKISKIEYERILRK